MERWILDMLSARVGRTQPLPGLSKAAGMVRGAILEEGMDPDRFRVVVFDAPGLRGFLWQFFGWRYLGISAGLLRALEQDGCRSDRFRRVLRHELEHARRGHWVRQGLAGLLMAAGDGLRETAVRMVRTIETEAGPV